VIDRRPTPASRPPRDVARSLYRRAHHLIRRLTAPIHRRRNVGTGTLIDPGVHVLAWRSVSIGRNCVVGGGTTFNINNGQGISRIVIGNNVFVGRFSFFSNGAMISVGDYCLLGTGCRYLGAGHDYSNPMTPYIACGVPDSGTITIGANCWLGTDVTLLGSLTVGHGSVLGARALVTRDVPPFSLVVGSPACVVKRFDVTTQAWIPVADFTAEMAALLPDEAAYLAILRTAAPNVTMPFAAAGPSQGDLA
jgi:acetyltransferase-like isoleucine patch superfamily enzyme